MVMEKNNLVQVFMDIAGVPQPLGNLWFHYRGGQESASFQYDPAWLSGPIGFPIDPDLPLFPGVYHSASLFGVFSDAAPDRWGRMLMRRGETSSGSLSTSDYLLRVDDSLRMGALRFRVDKGPFLAADSRIRVPPLTELPRLIAAAQRLDAGNDDKEMEDIRLLLRPGASLGGAHPKAAVMDKDGSLWIAKFPGVHAEDRYRSHWEYLAIHLAKQSGIRVPEHQLLHLADNTTAFLTRRFDRDAHGHRIHYASAMTILGAHDGETRSYEEIAEALRELGSPAEDIRELWQRLAFSVLVSNVDDHLRNHGVIWLPTMGRTPQNGFRLSPAFDINPAQPRQDRATHGTTVHAGGSTTIDFTSVWAAAGDFLWEESGARATIQRMVQAVSTWAEEAKKAHIPKAEMDRWSGAFEHEDFAVAKDIGQLKIFQAEHNNDVVRFAGVEKCSDDNAILNVRDDTATAT
jgi:serine/threonine-protein kinase HipA